MEKRRLLMLASLTIVALSFSIATIPVLAAGSRAFTELANDGHFQRDELSSLLLSRDNDEDDEKDNDHSSRTPTPASVAQTQTPTSDPRSSPTASSPSRTVTLTPVPITAASTPFPNVEAATPTAAPPTPSSTMLAATSTPTKPIPKPTISRGTSGLIVMDGNFDDWTGREYLSKKCGHEGHSASINFFYWGTNPNGDQLFFMLEPCPDSVTSDDDGVVYQIHIDTNNDGNYSSTTDRIVEINYRPLPHSGLVKVDVKRPNGSKTGNWNGQWGEPDEGQARRAEAPVSFASLGIDPRQTIRMYATADDNDRIPEAGDIQVSPIPILDYPLLALVTAGAIALVWWKRGRFAWQK